MPIGTLLIFSLFANNVRTAGLIGMGDVLIGVFRPRKGEGACRESIGGTCTCRLRLAQSLFLAFSRITSERLVRSEPLEALIDVFPPREDDGCLLRIDRWHLAHADCDWHNPNF